MPYIPKARRDAILSDFNSDRQTAGELNFMLTQEIMDYLDNKGLSYQTINDISGALTECLAEFRRQVVVPYEIKKAKLNGNVYKQVLGLLRKVK